MPSHHLHTPHPNTPSSTDELEGGSSLSTARTLDVRLMRRLILLGKQAFKVLRNRDPVCQLVQLLAKTVDGLLIHVRLGDELWEVGCEDSVLCSISRIQVGGREGKGREGEGEGRRTHETAQVLCSVGRKRILAGDGWVKVLGLPVLAGIVVLLALETVDISVSNTFSSDHILGHGL